MNTSADFSQIFASLLKQSRLSQLEIAERTGIHKQTINRYVKGKTLPGWTELIRLADAFGCTLDAFRTGELVPTDEVSQLEVGKLEQMKPIIKELGSVVNKLTSFISD